MSFEHRNGIRQDLSLPARFGTVQNMISLKVTNGTRWNILLNPALSNSVTNGTILIYLATSGIQYTIFLLFDYGIPVDSLEQYMMTRQDPIK